MSSMSQIAGQPNRVASIDQHELDSQLTAMIAFLYVVQSALLVLTCSSIMQNIIVHLWTRSHKKFDLSTALTLHRQRYN